MQFWLQMVLLSGLWCEFVEAGMPPWKCCLWVNSTGMLLQLCGSSSATRNKWGHFCSLFFVGIWLLSIGSEGWVGRRKWVLFCASVGSNFQTSSNITLNLLFVWGQGCEANLCFCSFRVQFCYRVIRYVCCSTLILSWRTLNILLRGFAQC